jgi:hypothetical protein
MRLVEGFFLALALGYGVELGVGIGDQIVEIGLYISYILFIGRY